MLSNSTILNTILNNTILKALNTKLASFTRRNTCKSAVKNIAATNIKVPYPIIMEQTANHGFSLTTSLHMHASSTSNEVSLNNWLVRGKSVLIFNISHINHVALTTVRPILIKYAVCICGSKLLGKYRYNWPSCSKIKPLIQKIYTLYSVSALSLTSRFKIKTYSISVKLNP